VWGSEGRTLALILHENFSSRSINRARLLKFKNPEAPAVKREA
jgi:hypothetical protein